MNYFKNNKISKVIFKQAVSLLLAFLLLVLMSAQGSGITYGADSTDAIEDEIEQAESEASAVQDEISSLNEELASLSNSIEELNTQITQTQAEIETLEVQIAEAEEEIAQNEEAAQTQYESLTAWIQVSYENAFDSLIMYIFSAESISEALSRFEYVRSLTGFGTDLIDRYNETLENLNAQKAELEEQNESLAAELETLEALEEETSQKKTEISSVISDAQSTLTALGTTIDELEAELASQEAYEAELEAQRVLEEAAQAAGTAQQETELTSSSVSETETETETEAATEAEETSEKEESEASSTETETTSQTSATTTTTTDSSDLDLLAALIYCEAGSEPYEGKVAVACVVMNRVNSSSFPNTISGVIYQSGQFGPASSGRLATVLANGLASSSCYEAASYVLAGNLTYPSYLYFCSASYDLSVETTVIGNHQFY